MTPLALLALLGLAILIPAFTDDDDDTDMDPPVEGPDIVNGTDAAENYFPDTTQIINAGGGNDLFSASGGAEDSVLNGEDGNDSFTLAAARVTANGGNGDDFFEATGRGTIINGEDGNDRIDIAGRNMVVDGGAGDDTFTASASVDFQINGNAGDDVFTISESTDFTANGGIGEDRFTVTDGVDLTVNGDAGDDTFTITRAGGTFDGGTGNDTLTAALTARSVNLSGGEGDDFLELSQPFGDQGGIARLDGGDGNDTLFAGIYETSSDTTGAILTGGAGFDIFRVQADIDPSNGTSSPLTTVDITDFVSGEDLVEIAPTVTGDSELFPLRLELSEATDGSYTDITLIAANAADGSAQTETVRVHGVTGLTQSDIVITGMSTGITAG